MFAFLFNQSQSKAGVINQMNHLCFRKGQPLVSSTYKLQQLKRKIMYPK